MTAVTGGKNMKETTFLQFNGAEIDLSNFAKSAKEQWKSAGNKLKDIQKLDLYVKPEEGKCYFVINDDFSGKMDLN